MNVGRASPRDCPPGGPVLQLAKLARSNRDAALMRKVNIHEAKTTLSQLVEAAEAGEKVILARAGRPVAQLVRLKKPAGVRLGVLKRMFPDEMLATAVKPLSKKDAAGLFGRELEP